MSNKIIRLENVGVTYDEKVAIENINVTIGSASVIGVLGPNGAGKSTLFKAILGLLDIEGEIFVNEIPLEKRSLSIAYVPQRSDVDWEFPATVWDIVETGRYADKKIFERLGKNDTRLIEQALVDADIVSLKNRQIGALSGGQQQRVFIARALCQQSDIFFFDEPFVGVDTVTENRIVLLMKQLASEGKMVLVIHHDLSSAKEYFDKVIFINKTIIASGDVADVFTEENLYKTYGGRLGFLPSN